MSNVIDAEVVSTEIATVQVRNPAEITPERRELIKRTICKGASNDELEMFIGICNRTRLDPFARQIYAIKRWDSKQGTEAMQAQASIDGFRLIAERSGKYAGQVGPWWCGADGEWHEVWVDKNPPVAAKVGVLRSDFKEPLFAVARYAGYVQTKKDGFPNTMWAKYPDVMLAKCAESLALRKAFPQDLSGLYTEDEMPQDGKESNRHPSVDYVPEQPKKPSDVDQMAASHLMAGLEFAAECGTASLKNEWEKIGKDARKYFEGDLPRLKKAAAQADADRAKAERQPGEEG